MKVIYDENFYKAQKDESIESAHTTVPLVLEVIGRRINSVVDVGCGLGTWLSVFKENGAGEILGIDGDYINRDMLMIDQSEFMSHDLTTKLEIDRNFDLALSLEVAEHIDRKSSYIFCENLLNLANVVFFSAAIPGQGGDHHVNEQWPAYWKKLFADHGYVMVDALRNRLWGLQKLKAHYAQNSFIYVKERELASYPQLKLIYDLGEKFPLNAVHPRLFDFWVRKGRLEPQSCSFFEVLKSLPSIFYYSITRHFKGQ